jgi:hypothetical protein
MVSANSDFSVQEIDSFGQLGPEEEAVISVLFRKSF